MTKKIMKKFMAVVMVAIMLASLTACGNGQGKGNKQTVRFMYTGSVYEIERYSAMIEEFNATVGKEKGITVVGSPKSSIIEGSFAQQLQSENGPDLFNMVDRDFKKNALYMEDLTNYVEQSTLDGLYPQLTERYHYDIETTTSNSDDPLYGLPIYNNTTVLYYNKDILKANGIICISVDEEDIDAFNAGEKDLNGKTKSDYGISVDVPKKGFYRSESPFVPAEGETDGSSWVLPSENEVMIFNDRIAMNWDEVEDIGMICTKEKNPASPSQYGYYTEWWFNYGWGVGGNCLEDLSGNGDWVYGLAAENPNYIVAPGKSYTGAYTGTVYNEGETLNFKDIIDAKQGDKISYETDQESYMSYTVNGETATMRDFSAEISNGTLSELPTTKEAFSRFAYLAGVGGLNVCPYPSAFIGTTSTAYFASSALALLVEKETSSLVIEKSMQDEWGIAPLPMYKVYETPEDPSNDTVVLQGAATQHSDGISLCMNKYSSNKEAATVFLNWAASEGQRVLAENGFLSCRPADEALMIEKLPYKNNQTIVELASKAEAGDWMYMPDQVWIDVWAGPLNQHVRYGKMELEQMLYGYIEETQEQLAKYGVKAE
ncbi:MAG: extracellular solute-binding protein [Tyzzerella sp.]|nr:extracellular solute-binding protein [Tyzzerella sp.]